MVTADDGQVVNQYYTVGRVASIFNNNFSDPDS